jgi:hypothetical protein
MSTLTSPGGISVKASSMLKENWIFPEVWSLTFQGVGRGGTQGGEYFGEQRMSVIFTCKYAFILK